jgi:hypothetical protein
LKKAIKMDAIDSSSGILLPYYDHDTRIVYLAGKVRFFYKWVSANLMLGSNPAMD